MKGRTIPPLAEFALPALLLAVVGVFGGLVVVLPRSVDFWTQIFVGMGWTEAVSGHTSSAAFALARPVGSGFLTEVEWCCRSLGPFCAPGLGFYGCDTHRLRVFSACSLAACIWFEVSRAALHCPLDCTVSCVPSAGTAC